MLLLCFSDVQRVDIFVAMMPIPKSMLAISSVSEPPNELVLVKASDISGRWAHVKELVLEPGTLREFLAPIMSATEVDDLLLHLRCVDTIAVPVGDMQLMALGYQLPN